MLLRFDERNCDRTLQGHVQQLLVQLPNHHPHFVLDFDLTGIHLHFSQKKGRREFPGLSVWFGSVQTDQSFRRHLPITSTTVATTQTAKYVTTTPPTTPTTPSAM